MIDAVAQVERIICDFWASAPSNSLDLETGEKAWGIPHVATTTSLELPDKPWQVKADPVEHHYKSYSVGKRSCDFISE